MPSSHRAARFVLPLLLLVMLAVPSPAGAVGLPTTLPRTIFSADLPDGNLFTVRVPMAAWNPAP